MTIREIINGLEENIIQLKEENVRLKEALKNVTEEKLQLERELHSLKKRQPRPELKPYVKPETKVIDNGDSDTPVEVKPKRSRRRKEVVE